MADQTISVSPSGEEFTLPIEADYQAENDRLAASRILVLGASYREDVGDTRYSGSELIVRKLTEMGAEVQVHDPYVKHWWELEKQETFPAPGHSWSRFFRNQESLTDIRVSQDLESSLKGVDAVILAVRHDAYQELEPEQIIAMVGNPAVIIDCFAMLTDTQIKTFFAAGYEVKGLGRGHMKRLKEEVAGK